MGGVEMSRHQASSREQTVKSKADDWMLVDADKDEESTEHTMGLMDEHGSPSMQNPLVIDVPPLRRPSKTRQLLRALRWTCSGLVFWRFGSPFAAAVLMSVEMGFSIVPQMIGKTVAERRRRPHLLFLVFALWRTLWRYAEEKEELWKQKGGKLKACALYARASYAMVATLLWTYVGAFVGLSGVISGALTNQEVGSVSHWLALATMPGCALISGAAAGCQELASISDTSRREAIMIRLNTIVFMVLFFISSGFEPFADVAEMPPLLILLRSIARCMFRPSER